MHRPSFFFLQYGKLLNLCFNLFKKDKEQGIISGTFSKWLLENIGIHESYARKLREIASLLGGYTTFRCVGLSFTEIYSLKKQIKVMLDSSIPIQNFWKKTDYHPKHIGSSRITRVFKPGRACVGAASNR